MYFQKLENQTVAQLLLKYLKLEGVTTFFGIPGGALKTLVNQMALDGGDYKFVVCRHETGAAYIAEGFSRLSGLPGVVMVTSGPGSTNALTGVMNAHANRHSLLLITGEVPEIYWGKGFLQEGIDADVDINAIYSAGTMFSTVVTHPNNFQQLFTMALRAAMSLPRQAVHVSLPDDISGTKPYITSTTNPPVIDYVVQFPVATSAYRTVPASRDPEGTQSALNTLTAATLPAILLGNGCREALRDPKRLANFIAFVHKYQIPVATTPDAKGIFPETHPLSLRSYGLAGSTWAIGVLDGPTHDAVLIIASALGELSTNNWNNQLVPQNGGAMIQVDLDQHAIGRVFPISQGIVAEAGSFIDDLCNAGMALPLTDPMKQAIAQRFELLTEMKLKQSPLDSEEDYRSDATPVHPAAMMRVVNEMVLPGTNIFIDAGNAVGWAANYLCVDPPSTVHMALGMGPMGWSVGCVIGAKMAVPTAPCISITGDGAFMMHGVEVSTAAAYNVGAIWIVFHDEDLLMVSQGMHYYFPDTPGDFKGLYSLGKNDLVKFSEALGADAQEINSVEGMRSALGTALKNAAALHKPQVIVARIDRSPGPPYYSRKNLPILV